MIKILGTYYWKSLVVVFGICFLSFISPSSFDEVPKFSIPHLDKLVHFLMYAVLSIVMVYDFVHHKKVRNTIFTFIAVCIVFPIALGGIIEILQQLFFLRSGDIIDWLFDVAGVLIGWLVAKIIGTTQQKNYWQM